MLRVRPKYAFHVLAGISVLTIFTAILASPIHAQYGQGYDHERGPCPYFADCPGYPYDHGYRHDYGWHGPYYRVPHMQGMQRPMGPRMGSRMGALIDSDGDGVITEDEAAVRHEEVFAAMDADGDDTLTLDEFLAVRMGPGAGYGPWHEQMQARKEDRYKSMDADGDGSVSGSEFMEAGKQRFAQSDLDNDGEVTVWEFRSKRRAWQ